LRQSAYYENDQEILGSMLGSAMLLSLAFGLIAGGTVYFLFPLFSKLFVDQNIAHAIRYASLGLLLFPLNKVLIAYINGLRLMRAFACMQSLRYVVVLLCVLIVCIADWRFYYSSLTFLAAEIITSCSVVIYLIKYNKLRHLRLAKNWLWNHVQFGGKAAIGGIFMDMNTRLDVLLLGTMLDTRQVGIYSFASMLIDGVQHVLSIIRVNFNPLLVTFVRDNDWPEAMQLLRRSKKYMTIGVTLLSILIIFGFLIAVYYVVPNKYLEQGITSLIIMLIGFIIISGFSPFDNIMLSAGFPSHQTLQIIIVTMVNLSLCLLLVPIIGINGAAIGTSLGYMSGTIAMIIMSKKTLGWNMLSNKKTEV
jgi:O-antigen/teichoic acid export membrane protein